MTRWEGRAIADAAGSKVEGIKAASNQLRGTIGQELSDAAPAFSPESQQLLRCSPPSTTTWSPLSAPAATRSATSCPARRRSATGSGPTWGPTPRRRPGASGLAPAYYELRLDGERAVTAKAPGEEPLYGTTYLPRKVQDRLRVSSTPSLTSSTDDLDKHSTGSHHQRRSTRPLR